MDIKILANNEKEFETLKQAVRIYSDNTEMESDRKIFRGNNEK